MYVLLVWALAPLPAFAFDIFADFLIWKASEETSSIWATSTSIDPDGVEVFEAHNLNFDWDLGFRVGVGNLFTCDCWDVRLYWTWFQSHASETIPTGEIILTQFFGGFLNDDVSESAKIRLDLKYNMFDGQLGREFCICGCFFLRPYMGIRGGWIDQCIRSEWQNFTVDPVTQFSSTENLTNNFWGIGPLAGIGSQWELGCYFFLFGDFETALLWGTWSNKDVYKNSNSITINTNMKDSHLGSLTMHAFAGLGWERNFGCWSHFTARLGYEWQIWFSQFRISTFQQLRVHGDLTLQGGTLNLSLAF